MIKHWYDLEFSRQNTCLLSTEDVKLKLWKLLCDHQLNTLFDERFYGQEWTEREDLDTIFCEISKKLPGVVLELLCGPINDDNFLNYYFDGEKTQAQKIKTFAPFEPEKQNTEPLYRQILIESATGNIGWSNPPPTQLEIFAYHEGLRRALTILLGDKEK